MLAAGVRVGAIEREGPEHRPVDGPGPRLRDRDRQRAGAQDQDSESPHNSSLLSDLRTD